MLYSLLTVATLFAGTFSQDICVSSTPVDSIYWWNGLWEANGTYNNKDYYAINVPGDTYYLYYDTYSGGSCPYSWMTNCWCFDTYAPGEWTFDCEVAGVGDTPDAVTEWYPDGITEDNSTFAAFTVATSDGTDCTSGDSQQEGGCYTFAWDKSSNLEEPVNTGKYRDSDKTYWNADQYKTSKNWFGIRYNYYLFISTGEGACNSTLLNLANNGAGYDYCWCFSSSYRAGTIGTATCNYQAPIATYTTTPDSVTTWYDSDGNVATAVEVTGDDSDDECDGFKLYLSFGFVVFLIFNIFVTN